MKLGSAAASATAIAALLLLGMAGPAAAVPVITVCASGCDATTIQGAVDLATAGDTIEVAAGTYTEVVNLDKADLVLRGAQGGVDARSRSGATETVLLAGQFKLLADGITIDGFTMDMNSTATSAVQGTGISGTQILNNIVENGTQGVVFDNPGPAAALVKHNVFRDNSGNGIQMFGLGDSQNVSIIENDFSGGHGAAVNVIGQHVLISGNTSTEDFTFLVLTDSSDVTVTHNTVTDADAGSGIFLGLGNDGVTISDNTLDSDAAPSDGTSAIRLSTAFGGPGASTDYTITDNVMTGGWSYAIRASDGAYDGILAPRSNQFGMIVANDDADPANAIDARDNWWDPAIDLTSMSNVITSSPCANPTCAPELASTGADSGPALGIAGGMMALGIPVLLLARRRRRLGERA